MIDFFVGHPTTRLLPTKEFLAASVNLLNQESPGDDHDLMERHPMNYGSDQGALSVRKKIAAWSGKKYQEIIDPEKIIITNGASYGAMNALKMFTNAESGYTKQAFVISPTYFLFNAIVIDAGFGGKTTSVPEGADGCDIEFLERELQRCEETIPDVPLENALRHVSDNMRKDRIMYKYLLYGVPTYSNPSGKVMSLECRKKLVALARKYDMLIVTDDVYDFLSYDEVLRNSPLPRLVSIDRNTLPAGAPGNVISNCSFSKLLGGGVRCGWQEAATERIPHILMLGGANCSGGCPSQLNSFIVGEMIDSGALDKIIDGLVEVFGERAREYTKFMRKYLPEQTKITGGQGGYFYWVELPEKIDAAELVKEATKRGVRLASGGLFETPGKSLGWGRSAIRVSLSNIDIAEAEKGFKIWGELCKEMMN
ncbi:hypothetical protein CANCADRAFT_74403 [Tortispora caseinolytica NRRL Y-17796]|uniref:Aminotransferase class I/classII large domain-containing protein n=1 Tax=Tortispora caseinolytica NRRL Y-17796 TaxID=767744 RepID=A0A1E4TIW9_9ASCO|nr:hypothetical protein CANCADRAFT_74403 [Tortispora caseinolytica NRRL Y-17796]